MGNNVAGRNWCVVCCVLYIVCVSGVCVVFTYAQKIRLPHSFPAEICIYKHEHEKPNKGSHREELGKSRGAGEMEKNTQAHEKAAMDVSPSLEWKQGASKRVAAAAAAAI